MRTSRPSVSVVLPAYNAARYIKSAVISILEQTQADIELIVIDDGSTDKTLAILKALQRGDSRLAIISRENRGLVRSLNEGVAAARAPWIARMDADDISTRDRIQKQIAFAEAQNLDVCGAYVRTFGYCRPSIRRYSITPAGVTLQLAFNTCFAHPTVVARTAVLKAHPYSESFEKIEDYELWTRLARHGFRLGNVPEVLLYYRRTFAQATSVHRTAQDEMRTAIAVTYARARVPMLSSDILEALLARTSAPSEYIVARAAQELHELIAAGHDVEHILEHNLKLFLAHNCTALGNETWGKIKTLLPRRAQLAIGAMRLAGFNPGHRLWNYLYLLK